MNAKETKAQRAMRIAETENGRMFRERRLVNRKREASKRACRGKMA